MFDEVEAIWLVLNERDKEASYPAYVDRHLRRRHTTIKLLTCTKGHNWTIFLSMGDLNYDYE